MVQFQPALNMMIRDAVQSDIAKCMDLDSCYESDYVWQMRIREEVGQYNITFNTERLPRTIEAHHDMDVSRLRMSLTPAHCFLVAQTKGSQSILGFLSMRVEATHKMGYIQDLVVDSPYRRQQIGTRLLKVARQWANEHQLRHLIFETRTQNYPAIMLCQKMGLTFCGFNDQYFTNHDIAIFFGFPLR